MPFDKQTFIDIASIFIAPSMSGREATMAESATLAVTYAEWLWEARERRRREPEESQESPSIESQARPGPQL